MGAKLAVVGKKVQCGYRAVLFGFLCAYDCTKRFVKGEGTKFYRFPRDLERRRRWVLATKRRDWTPTEHARICSDHFVGGKLKYFFLFVFSLDY